MSQIPPSAPSWNDSFHDAPAPPPYSSSESPVAQAPSVSSPRPRAKSHGPFGLSIQTDAQLSSHKSDGGDHAKKQPIDQWTAFVWSQWLSSCAVICTAFTALSLIVGEARGIRELLGIFFGILFGLAAALSALLASVGWASVAVMYVLIPNAGASARGRTQKDPASKQNLIHRAAAAVSSLAVILMDVSLGALTFTKFAGTYRDDTPGWIIGRLAFSIGALAIGLWTLVVVCALPRFMYCWIPSDKEVRVPRGGMCGCLCCPYPSD
jgi:hypothetical protein